MFVDEIVAVNWFSGTSSPATATRSGLRGLVSALVFKCVYVRVGVGAWMHSPSSVVLGYCGCLD